MAFLAPIAAIASSAFGIYSQVKAQKQAAAPPPKVQAPPAAPKVEDAAAAAKADVERRRRISLLSGGQTDLTRGSGLAGSSSVAQKQLLGV